ncbi:uncharacterized protein CCDC197 [Chanos chanos]|uniref:Uncharacterized protein CCDC197 n=1 Tax=Chanos chanos TaxID=29144 RepID=A0A6J2WL33_CHACN|nr:uncharacterized protein CCDC197 [Chanos chanos]
MDTPDPPVFFNKDDPRLKLRVETRTKNIFVTQLGDVGYVQEPEDENVNYIPVITESPDRIVETGVNTLQRTLVLRKKIQVDETDRQLAQKRLEFKGRMQALEQRRAELALKQLELKEKAVKFQKFVEENEVRRRRALKKYQLERKQNELKQAEWEELTVQLERLQARQQYLKERVAKHKIYEDYLMKVVDLLPDNYGDNGSDSVVMPIIRRFETLSMSKNDLAQRLDSMVEELEQGQRNLELLKQEHNNNKLIANKELSGLQTQLDQAKDKNKQLEMTHHIHQGQYRDQLEELGSLLIAVRNLGQQCHLQHYGPLENMDLFTMLDMVKEFVLEKANLERRATRLMHSASVKTSGTANKKGKTQLTKNTSSEVQLKSYSKISGKSGLLSSSKMIE